MGTQIGHYDIVAELGRGGMGVVYKGHEATLNRYVAIKMLSPQLAHEESIRERFLREARSMAVLNDPHIIQIYFIGEWEGQPYFAMEFVEGESLSSFLKREGHMSPDQAVRVVYQTCQGLSTAHDKGVVHRDLKPANLMLDQRGRIKIADFGIALSSTDFSKKLTSTGEFVGTPGYLSPEVCTGKVVDNRSDIFSLGIVLFELLAGRMPFTDESPLGLMLEVVRAEIPDVRSLNADVDAQLTGILQKMTAKDPVNRYQNCHDLIADLEQHPAMRGGQTITAKPIISTSAGTVVGMKTPPQLNRPAPSSYVPTGNTGAANQAVAAQAAAVSEPTPAPAARRPSVMEQQAKRSNSNAAVIWSVAAVLVLGLTGGLVYAMRDKLFGGQGTRSSTLLTASSTPANPAGNTTASTPATQPATSAPSATAAAPPVDLTAPVGTNPALPPPTDAVASTTEPGHTGIAGAATAPDEGDTAAGDELGPLQRMAAQRELGPLQRMAAQRKAQIAKNTPPPPPTAPPRPAGPPKVAVVAIGDPAITGPAKQVLEEALLDGGFLLVDDALIPGLAGAADAGDIPEIMEVLSRGAGVRAVAIVRAQGIGQTQLNYYGQSDTMYSATLSVRTYDIANRSPLTSGVQAKVDFTALNADFKAREAVQPSVGRLVGSLAAFRPRGSGG
jgi:serine/threonine-protein kinase